MRSLTPALLASLLDLPDASPQVQRWALRVGLSTGDDALLAKLALHPALEAELDTALAEVDSAGTRAAWLARPGRQKKVVLASIEQEKRATVLRAIAVMPGLPEATYDAVAEKLGKTTLADLIANDAAPLKARVRAAQRFAELSDPVTKTTDGLTQAIQTEPAIARAILDQVHSCAVAVLCMDNLDEVSKADVERLVTMAERLVNEAGDNTRDRRLAESGLDLAVTALMSRSVTDAQRDRLRACLKVLRKKNKWYRGDASLGQAIDCLPGPRGQVQHPAAQAIIKAKSEKDALAAYATARKAKVDPMVLLMAAAQAPKISREEFASMLEQVRLNYAQFHSLWRLLRDPGKLAAFYIENTPQYLDEGLARLQNPTDGLVQIAEMYAARGWRLPEQVRQSRYFSPELMLQMPAAYFVASGDHLPVEALAQVQDALTAALDGDESIDVLMALSEEFTGSLEELFKVSGAL